MKAWVDTTLCDANGLCQEVCPEVFQLNGDKVDVKVDEVPPEAMDACRDATLGCPRQAIWIQE
jgi:ferredoxin